jgi:hypothetical protein
MMYQAYLWLAQQTKITPEEIGIPSVTDADQAVSDILDLVYIVAGITCVIVIVIAGFMFTTASGDASLIKKAREMVIGAVIGLVVILLAFVITGFVLGRFTAG